MVQGRACQSAPFSVASLLRPHARPSARLAGAARSSHCDPLQPGHPMQAIAETRWAVITAVDLLLGHIANGRSRQTLACFSGDPDCALFGSEAGERAVGPEE